MDSSITTQPAAPTAQRPIHMVQFDTTDQEIIDVVLPGTDFGVHSGRSIKQTAEQTGHPIVLMELREAALLRDQKYHKPPMPMTQERFDGLLNVLPPCQWMRQGGIEHFYVSERISGEVVQYCVRFGQAFWGLCDRAGLTTAEIAQRIQAAEAAQAPTPQTTPA